MTIMMMMMVVIMSKYLLLFFTLFQIIFTYIFTPHSIIQITILLFFHFHSYQHYCFIQHYHHSIITIERPVDSAVAISPSVDGRKKTHKSGGGILGLFGYAGSGGGANKHGAHKKKPDDELEGDAFKGNE